MLSVQEVKKKRYHGREANHMDKRVQSLQKKIDSVKKQISKIGDIRPGSLSEQYNVCGTPNCQCKADPPKKHGPYFQLSYTRKGKSRSRFIKPHHLSRIKSEVEAYRKLKTLVDEWIDLSTELSDIRLKSPPQGGSP
jgi:hypothetical protein